MEQPRTKTLLGLGAGIALSPPGEPPRLTGRYFDQPFPDLTAGCTAALRALAAGDIAEEVVDALAGSSMAAMLALEALKYQLSTLGALGRSVAIDDTILATLQPMASGAAFAPGAAKTGTRYRLSRFAYLRRVDDTLEVQCPLGRARIVCRDGRVAMLLAALATPATSADLAAVTTLLEPAVRGLLDLLLHAQAAYAEGNAPATEDDLAHPVGGWEFHDLLFHMRTRLGRHDQPVGGTFPMKGKSPPPSVREPRPWTHDIALAEPDPALLDGDPSLANVVARRRSTRTYGAPIDLDTLGAFLHRVARVQHVITTNEGEMDLSLRPYPGGGAIHELEIYAIVGDCAGLDAGIYHYDPFDHRLGLVTPDDATVRELRHIAWQTADRKSPPQIFFVITARFRRLQWKYQSVAYAVILKNVGVLYEAMYLTATAMNLAPCSLGGGTIDLFCTAAGLDPYAESPVGEFMLGTRETAA